MSKEYPRTMYKKGGLSVWGKDHKYSSIIVADKDEEEVAEDNGYLDSFEDALFGEEKKPTKKKAKPVVEEKNEDSFDEEDF